MGRWTGSSYRCYIQNPVPEKKFIFKESAEKILNDFLLIFFCRKAADQDQQKSPDSGKQRRV
jgi:hypothetical protein